MKLCSISRLLAISGCAVGVSAGVASAQIASDWRGAVSGSWNDATRWTTDPVFPNNNGSTVYAATIAATGAAYTVDLNVPITVASLSLTSADARLALIGSNNFTLTGNLAFSGRGEMVGQAYTGTLRVRGSTTLSGAQLTGLGPAFFDDGVSFTGLVADDINDTCVIHGNQGVWSGNRDIRLNGNSMLVVTTGSTFTVSSTGSILWDEVGSMGFISNAGTLVKTGAGSTNFSRVRYNNTGGTLDVRAGTLTMDNYAVTGNQLTQGAWKVSGGGNIDLQGVTVLTNAADVTISGATSQFGALNGLTSNALGGKLAIEGGKSFATTSSFTNSGTLAVAASSSFMVAPGSLLTNFNTATATLTGGVFNIKGTLKFDNTGIAVIDSALTLDGAAATLLTTTNTNALATTRKITTNGTLALKNGRSFTTGANFKVEGNNSGVLDIDPTSDFAVGSGFTLENYDLLTKKLSEGDFRVAGRFEFQHSGIEVLDAKLTLDGVGATIVDTANVDALTPLAQIDGFGALSLRNSANFVANAADVGGFTFTVAATGRLDVDSGSQLDILGDLVNYAGGTFTGGVFNVGGTLRARNITNITTISTPIGLDSAGGLITNFTNVDVFETVNLVTPTGSLRISNGRQLSLTDATGVNNTGTLTVGSALGSPDTARVVVANDFTQSGGTSVTTVQNGGRLLVQGNHTMQGGRLDVLNSIVTVNGNFAHQGGTVGLSLGGSLLVGGSYSQTGGELVLSGGSLTAAGTSFAGGTLSGDGSINGDIVTGGVISPGDSGGGRGGASAGRIFVTGDSRLIAGSGVTIDLREPFPGVPTGYDQFDTAGALVLEAGSVLTLRFVERPAPGEVFVPVVFGEIVGAFDRIEGLVIDQTMYLVPVFSPTSIAFIVVEIPSAPGLLAPLFVGGAVAVRRRR